ncbi:protein kinase, partial [candidate division KSB1 bacterium]|nr:protein kinase [candidate division KSB1 bacterium]
MRNSFAMIGKTISFYKIIEKIGEGGMGVVYKAEDTKLKREVAIKFLPRQIAAAEEQRKRFKIEAQAAAALNHPNIATIYAIEEVDGPRGDGEMFIVMEYIKGGELKQLLINERQLTIDKVLDYATQIAEGLQAAHEKGITHRDIKSSNIMITEKSRVKIMDFGLAKTASNLQLTKEGMTLGTVAYMSPEQTQGIGVDHRTDIWAFGVVLYEMLAGEQPFKGDYEQAIFYSILSEEPQNVSDLNPSVPTELIDVVAKALQKELADRYQNMGELITDLKKSFAGPETQISKSAGQENQDLAVAVLPFADLSPQKDQEYFCDGITEELIDALAKIEGWRVVSRTSVFAFKGKEQDIRMIGEQLNVSHALEGSVRKAGEQVRITARLIDVVEDWHLWGERYDRPLTDIFALQDEIRGKILTALRVKLTAEEQQRFSRAPTTSLEAYDFYLLGLHQLRTNTPSSNMLAIQHFERAIEMDPSFARAYAGLSQ